MLTESEIAESTLNSVKPNVEEEDEEKEREERQLTTRKEMLNAIKILRCAVEENGIGENKFSVLNNSEYGLSPATPFGKHVKLPTSFQTT